jgi:hypothetical protein
VKTILLLALVFASYAVPITLPMAEDVDSLGLVKIIDENPEIAESIGWFKLSDEEKQSLSQVFTAVYLLGFEAGRSAAVKMDSISSPTGAQALPHKVPVGLVTKAYKTRLESDEGDVLILDNGAVVEISSGYLGYLGYRKQCILFSTGARWRIWIQGKRTYACELLKPPQYGYLHPAEQVLISEVKGDGKILVMSHGAIYEVADIYTISTSLWLGMSEALILDDCELINFDEADEVVEVIRLK